MNCTTAQQLIHELLDGEISADRRLALDEHVQACEDCLRMKQQFEAMVGGFDWLANQSATLGDETPPVQAQPGPGRIIRFPAAKWAAVATAVAAAIVLMAIWPTEVPTTDLKLALRDKPGSSTPASQAADPEFEFDLTGQSFDDYIAVQQDSGNPRVHIVWLHPVDTPKQLNGSSRAPLARDDHQVLRS